MSFVNSRSLTCVFNNYLQCTRSLVGRTEHIIARLGRAAVSLYNRLQRDTIGKLAEVIATFD